MKQQQHKSFMGQFQAARQEVAEMRAWMGESAKVATLTFPANGRADQANRRASQPDKKKR
jgi:hypothetical protein